MPLVTSFMKSRKKTLELGELGPCKFKPVDTFFRAAIKETKNYKSILTPIPVVDGQQVVAIGDIHADMLVLLGCLYLLGVINIEGYWIGGNTIVVQCGDLLDRSGRAASVMTDNPREEVDIVQYLFYLNKSAQSQGGGIYWVLGNHDVSRVLWKYYEGNKIAVEDPDEHKRRIRRTPDYRKYIGNQHIGWGGTDKMKEIFSPGGLMAIYMSMYTTYTLQVGYYVFMHGGLTIETIQDVKKELRITKPEKFFDMVNRHVSRVFIGDTPISAAVKKIAWNRTWSKEKPLERGENWELKKYAITAGVGMTKAERYCTKHMRKIFKAVNMNWENGAFVLGHSIQESGIPLYCKGRVWRIDLGMSEAFSSGKIPKVIGGLKIFMHPATNQPVEVLVVMNYSNPGGTDHVDQFILYINRNYRRILIDPLNPNKNKSGFKPDFSKVGAFWRRGIIDVEMVLQKNRKRKSDGGDSRETRKNFRL
jgi:predicted MPP superfamily phosphohydrolase